MIPPALLKKAFGTPDEANLGFAVSGLFTFEDSNLDVFQLHDYKQTDFYHGVNRPTEFYYTLKNMKRAQRRRVKSWPSIEEFWALEEPKPFRLLASA